MMDAQTNSKDNGSYTEDPFEEKLKGTWNPRVESPQNGITYAFTISPNPIRWKGFPSCRHQYMEVLPDIYKAFKNIGQFELYPELNKKGNIHFHGYLKVCDRYKFLKTKCSIIESIGFMYLKQIDDPAKWKKYILKDYEDMKVVLEGLCPFPVTNDSWKLWLLSKETRKKERKAMKAEAKKTKITNQLIFGDKYALVEIGHSQSPKPKLVRKDSS